MTMLLALLLMLQQTPPTVVWSDMPDLPQTPKPIIEPVPLPLAAIADPYGWERAQCSPYIRNRDEPLEICQQRIRLMLASGLGDRLPPALKPSDAMDDCRLGGADTGYALQCGPRPVQIGGAPPVREPVCDNRPQRSPSGAIAFNSECRPAPGDANRQEGLTIRLGGG